MIGESEASIGSINLKYVKNIRFTGLNISKNTTRNLVSTYDTENIIFDHNYISGGSDYESWDSEKWQKIGRFLDVEAAPNIDVQSNRKDKRKPRKSGFATKFIVSMKAFRLAWKGLKSPLS